MISEKSAAELLIELDAGDETEHLEAKATTEDVVGKSAYETICSLSNEPDLGGGTILLGVSKEEALFPFYKATGVSDPDKVISDLVSGCATQFNIPVRPEVSVERVGAVNIVRVDVPEVHPSQKPIYFKSQGLPRGAFRRIGSTDQRCTDDDLIAFFHMKAQEPHDTHIIGDATWDDIDPSAIEAYRRARKDANPLAEELNWTDEEILVALGAAARSPDGPRITATGLLVFGRAIALRRITPVHRIDYVRMSGKSWIDDPDEPYDSVDIRGPLISIIGRVMAAVLDDLPRTFRVDESSGKRVEIPIIPTRVLREAIVNAVMHRSYQIHRPIQIIRYSNRVVIKNPGYSLKSEERFDEPGSAIRNPHIAEILHETRYAEQKGSGIRVMKEHMSRHGLSVPTFNSDRVNDEFSVTFLFHHFLSESDWRWLSNFTGYSLTEDQMRALIFVRETGAIDNSAYRSLMHVDTLTASRSLRYLREQNLLTDRGSGSRTHYVAGAAMQDFLDSDDASMHASGLSNITMEQAHAPTTMADVPPGLRARIQSLGKRIDPVVFERIIVDLCSWQPLSAEEIASILGRTTNYVSNKFLYRMVREGTLSYLYPKMVKHPGQKYQVPCQGNRK